MTTIADIEALGIEVPKGRDWATIAIAYIEFAGHLRCCVEALAEAYAVIERLVGEVERLEHEYRSGERPATTTILHELMMKSNRRAEQAERDLAAAREEARKWEWVARHEPDNQTGLARAELGIRSGNYVEWLLARYQPEEDPAVSVDQQIRDARMDEAIPDNYDQPGGES